MKSTEFLRVQKHLTIKRIFDDYGALQVARHLETIASAIWKSAKNFWVPRISECLSSYIKSLEKQSLFKVQ